MSAPLVPAPEARSTVYYYLREVDARAGNTCADSLRIVPLEVEPAAAAEYARCRGVARVPVLDALQHKGGFYLRVVPPAGPVRLYRADAKGCVELTD